MLHSRRFRSIMAADLLIIPLLQRITRQPAKHQPRNRGSDAPLPIALSDFLRSDRPSDGANHTSANASIRSGKVLFRLVERASRRFRARRAGLVAAALLRGAVGGALVLGGGRAVTFIVVTDLFAMAVGARSAVSVVVVAVASVVALRVAISSRGVWRWRVAVVAAVVWLVSPSAPGHVGILGRIVLVRIRHAIDMKACRLGVAVRSLFGGAYG